MKPVTPRPTIAHSHNPNPVTEAPAGGKGIRLKLRNGETVEGEVLAETAEGWALRLPDGETQFFDKLDVISDLLQSMLDEN